MTLHMHNSLQSFKVRQLQCRKRVMAAIHSLDSGVLALAALRLEEVFLHALLADIQMHVQGESGYESLGQ
jgi:hypothetical protein